MGSSYFLPAAVGPQLASRMLLTGETVNGEEAERMGLVAEAVDKDHVLPRATALATRMAEASPVAVRTCVRTLRSAHDRGLDQALWREAEAQADSYASAVRPPPATRRGRGRGRCPPLANRAVHRIFWKGLTLSRRSASRCSCSESGTTRRRLASRFCMHTHTHTHKMSHVPWAPATP